MSWEIIPFIRQKEKGFFNLKTTISHFDYYFVIISELRMFYTRKDMYLKE